MNKYTIENVNTWLERNDLHSFITDKVFDADSNICIDNAIFLVSVDIYKFNTIEEAVAFVEKWATCQKFQDCKLN